MTYLTKYNAAFNDCGARFLAFEASDIGDGDNSRISGPSGRGQVRKRAAFSYGEVSIDV